MSFRVSKGFVLIIQEGTRTYQPVCAIWTLQFEFEIERLLFNQLCPDANCYAYLYACPPTRQTILLTFIKR